jgi:SAM-dependent methyltransferase
MAAHSVRELYERFPYPSPSSATDPILDAAIGVDLACEDLAGATVLDAGCGTGHRLVGLALQFPDTLFVGIDFSSRSLEVAADLVEKHSCRNVRLRRHAIGGEPLGERFDLVTSTGVLHHLPDPAAGVSWLAAHLRPEGVLYAWLYHSYGEFDRMLDRRLIGLLVGTGGGGEQLVRDLGLGLSSGRYGGPAGRPDFVADADAYLNPQVTTYDFDSAGRLLGREFDWAVAGGVTWPDGAGSIDVTAWDAAGYGVISAGQLFPQPRPRAAFLALAARDQLRCLELAVRPTGFSVICGRAPALSRCTDRVRRAAARAGLIPAKRAS